MRGIATRKRHRPTDQRNAIGGRAVPRPGGHQRDSGKAFGKGTKRPDGKPWVEGKEGREP